MHVHTQSQVPNCGCQGVYHTERASDDNDARMVTSVITLFCLCVKVIHIYGFTTDLNEIISWWGLSLLEKKES